MVNKNRIINLGVLVLVTNLMTCVAGLRNDFPNLDSIVLDTSEAVQEQASKDVICRLIPNHCHLFKVSVYKKLLQNGKDTFTIRKENGYISISGSSGVACTWGFHFYIKNVCNCHVGWQSKQIDLPDELPPVDINITANDRLRYYQNVCTTSYSFVWWDVDKWRQHIDWMALNGVNIALASQGQEIIWQRVYRRLNLTENDINDHFSGPAFLSWQRMGNIRGWAGPLSSSWHLHSLKLEHFIIEAMTNLSMIPVLPAFAGHVPKAFKRVFPDANLIEMEPWNKFRNEYCCPLFLDPLDPLFNHVGQMFLLEMKKEFGLYHVYNSDSFNENKPSSGDVGFLKAVGSSIYESMSSVDPDAVWLLQGWMFLSEAFYWTQERVKALLTSVDKGKVLVLDLQSEQWPQYQRFDMYYGQPFIWCMLHNFGGTLGMFGDSQAINHNVYEAREDVNSTMVGTGLTPEGINQNYVMYELMLETSIRKRPVDINMWTEYYTLRRYGGKDANLIQAWQLLMKSVYNYTGLNKIRGKYVISRRPSIDIKPWAWYKSKDLFEAWKLFVNSSSEFESSECFRYDLTDVTRQVLQYKADQIYTKIVNAFYNKDLVELEKYANVLMSLFEDLDEILSSNKGFLLGNWLESAKALAYNNDDKRLFELNARNQITLWGPNGEIIDYANKQWAGMVSDFFAPRWRVYLSEMYDSVKNNQKFNKSAVQNKVFTTVERPFTLSDKTYPVFEIGNTVEIATRLCDKWFELDNYPDVPIKVQYKDSLISEDHYKRTLYRQHRQIDDEYYVDELTTGDDEIIYNVVLLN